MLITLAVIAPVWSAGPNAVAHRPTAMAADVAEASLVKVVCDVKVTVDFWVVVLGLVDLELGFFVFLVLDGLGGKTGTIPLTTKVDPEIEVTVPKAVEKRPAAPRGSDPFGNVPLGKVPPGGRNRPKPPVPALPPPASPSIPSPRVHDPVELGWVIDTAVAVKCFEVDLVDELLLVAVTQSPTARSDEGMASVWVKFVAGVQLTVTWPLVGF